MAVNPDQYFGIKRCTTLGVSGKGGYGRTRMRTWTISKCTFTFTQHLFFIPNVVVTAVFASKPRHQSFTLLLYIYKCRGEVVKG